MRTVEIYTASKIYTYTADLYCCILILLIYTEIYTAVPERVAEPGRPAHSICSSELHE
jgi:hypothetical protein